MSAECTFVTPAITSQRKYDRNGPLPRPAELRGQLRWAFRTVAASLLSGDELRRVEAELWGGRPSKNADPRPSPVSVRLRKSVDKNDAEEGGACTRSRARYSVEITRGGRLRVTNRCYLCPAIYLNPRGANQEQPLVIRAGATFELELVGLEDDALEVARRSLELLSLTCGYGRRSRRAFGCFEVRFDDGTTTRVDGLEGFIDALRENLDDLRTLVLDISEGASGPVETFPNFSDATLWAFEYRGRTGGLLQKLGDTLKSARRDLRNERPKSSNVELRWVLGSSSATRESPGLLRSPLLLSVTPIEPIDTRERNRGTYVVSILLLSLEEIRWKKGKTRVGKKEDREKIEEALREAISREFNGVKMYSIEVTEDRARVTST